MVSLRRLMLSMCLCACAAVGQKAESTDEISSRWIDGTMIDGHDIKYLTWSGDAAAVSITRSFAGRRPSAHETEMAVRVLETAFGSPSIIEKAENREPKTTLFVLAYLESVTKDSAMKKRINAARSRILENCAKAKS